MSAPALSSDITIIGGGIIGAALAYELAKRNASVTLVERRELGREASWASAGIISPPGPRHVTRADLALASFTSYPSLIQEVQEASGISVGYVPTGEIDVGTDHDRPALEASLNWQQRHGLSVEWLDGAAIREREPALHERFTCGVYAAQAGSVILSQMTLALARAATLHGATVLEHTPVTRIEVASGRAVGVQTFDRTMPTGTVVIAAGAWSRLLGDSIDFTIPTVPVRGQMMAIADPPVPIRSVIAGGGGYLVPRADGTIAVGATEEHDAGFDTRVTPAGIAWLTALVERVAPTLAQGRLASTWAGLRPGTEHGELIVGRVPHLDNVWIASGHYRSGALLAPATADALATSILKGELAEILAPFTPSRQD